MRTLSGSVLICTCCSDEGNQEDLCSSVSFTRLGDAWRLWTWTGEWMWKLRKLRLHIYCMSIALFKAFFVECKLDVLTQIFIVFFKLFYPFKTIHQLCSPYILVKLLMIIHANSQIIMSANSIKHIKLSVQLHESFIDACNICCKALLFTLYVKYF